MGARRERETERNRDVERETRETYSERQERGRERETEKERVGDREAHTEIQRKKGRKKLSAVQTILHAVPMLLACALKRCWSGRFNVLIGNEEKKIVGTG